MFHSIKQFFEPPIFDNEEKTRIASHLYLLLKISTIPVVIFLIIFPLITRIVNQRTVAIFVGLLLLLLELMLVKKGYVRLSAIIFVTSLWVIGNYTALSTGGVRAVGFGINLVIVFMAGMLISLRAALVYGLMSSLLGLVMAIMQTRGSLPPISADVNAFSAWITQSVLLMFMAGLMYLTVNYIQQALLSTRRAEARLRGLIENTSDFVTEVDRTGKIILTNRFPDQFIGKDIREFLFKNDIPVANEALRQTLDENKKTSLEIQIRDLDNTATWNSVRIGPIVQEGQVTSLTVFVSDITEGKQIELEREKLLIELEQRNAELERYTYTLSHELKTPIVSIRGFLGFLEQDMEKGNMERARHDFARIGHAADKMYKMISELIELSRIGRLINTPEDVSFEEIALAGLNNAEASLPGHNAQIHIQPDMPTVHVDLTRMIEVVQNLIENAIKYTKDQPNPQITIGMRSEQDEPVFFVRDNGMGIDPEYHKRVFNIFEQLNPQNEGTGIGLALVKRIIEAHNGKIWVESEGNGKGSTFCFTLLTAKLQPLT